MITAQEKPKPEKSLLSITQSKYLIRHGRGRPQTITREELIRLTTSSRIRRIRRIRSILNNQTTKQRNNTTTQTHNQHNTTPIGPNPNIYGSGHIRKQTYTPQNSGGDTTFCVGDLLCGFGGCVVKWCAHLHSSEGKLSESEIAHTYSCVSYIVTVCIRGVAQFCRYIAAHSVVCSHTVKHLTTRQSHRRRIKTLPHSLTSHPISTHKKGGRGVVVRVLCWGV